MKTNKKTVLVSLLLSFGMMSAPSLSMAAQEVEDKKLYQFFTNNNITNKELANALINYDAAARMNAYNLNRELLFMSAPFYTDARNAGANIGAAIPTANSVAKSMGIKGLLNSIALFTSKDKVTIGGKEYAIPRSATGAPNTYGLPPHEVWKLIGRDFLAGKTGGTNALNPSLVLNSNNLKASGVTDTQGQQMVNFLSNPMPYANLNIEIKNALESLGRGGRAGVPGLTGAKLDAALEDGQKDEVAKYLMNSAVYGLSASALSDIIARRTPPAGNNKKSVMEIMDSYSKQRFTSDNWYKETNTVSEAALLREIAQMQAYNTWMQYQIFRVSEQQMALLASMNTAIANLNVVMQEFSRIMQQSTADAAAAAAEAQSQMSQ